jgi:hypothetical protein
MKNINGIACQLLNCWYLDIEFLDKLLGEYPEIDIDIDEVRMNYWKVDDINILIYEAYSQIKKMFFEENEEKITSLWFSIEDIEDNEEYTIFTNYFDSHLRFKIPEIDAIYQNWRKH